MDEENAEPQEVLLTDREGECLRAAYRDLFGQEQRMVTARLGPVEPTWTTRG